MLKNVKPRFQAWLVVYLNSKKNASFREWPFCVQKKCTCHLLQKKNASFRNIGAREEGGGRQGRREEKTGLEAARIKQTQANVCG